MIRPGDGGAERLFCSKPFTWFEVSRGTAEGEVYLCCPSWLPRPVGNLNRQSVAAIWNGETAQDIRRSILDGSFRHCDGDRCPHLRTQTGPVQPISTVTDPELLAAIRGELAELPHGPRAINCSYDRSCNLSCPSCRTQVIVETARRTEIAEIQRKLQEEALPGARLLYITGSGDPFGSPFFRAWLRTMRRSDAPLLETIRLHTNGLLWTPAMWASISDEIRALVRFADISIDAATPGTYAINRRGGNWDVLLRNLEFIGGLRAEGPLEWLGINMVVQENNYEEMPAFIELGRRFGVDTVCFHQLVNWGTFTDQEFKRRAVHLADHPHYPELLRILGTSVFRDPIVFAGNLPRARSYGPMTALGSGTPAGVPPL